MDIDVKDLITLDNNQEYVVISKINYENNIYIYLTNIYDVKDIKFCMQEELDNQTSVIEIDDSELLKILIPLFYEESKKNWNDLEEQ